MSYLRAGRGGENRRSVFYTGNNLSNSAEEWELVDPPSKDFPEQKNPTDAHRSMSTPCCLTQCLFLSSVWDQVVLIRCKRNAKRKHSLRK